MKASELRPHPANWRTHPKAQQDALRGVLAEIGYADALLCRELPDGSLEILDGHLRAETTPDAEVPVLITDLDDAEARALLLIHDPLGAMAEANHEALIKLLSEIETQSDGVQDMLDALAAEHGLSQGDNDGGLDQGDNDVDEEWAAAGMPEYEHQDLTPFRSILVHFQDQAGVDGFAKLIGQSVPDAAKWLWHPAVERIRHRDNIYDEP
ncbi:MAG: hypothetical protein GY835_24540 [bacterium]|nr:hypothetical protein [bacterium]